MTKKIGDESIEEVLESGILDSYRKQYPELFQYVEKLSGLPKSFGSHPCGKVISQDPASTYNAIEYDSKTDTWVLQGDMHTADDLGLVKCDFLGLRTLDVIYDTLEMIGKDYNYIAPHKIDTSDKAVWDEFAAGHTDCIFQFESDGMKSMLKDMHCNCIDNLSASNALYRPGAKAFISNYVNRKNGDEEVTYLHPDLEPILKRTYGIIVFQEQLIEIGRLAGLQNPDELRKATAKKKPELMAKIEPLLKDGLMKRGWERETCDKLWETILDFARYSFNKCVAGSTHIIKPDGKNSITVEELFHKQKGCYGLALSMFPDSTIHQNIIVDVRQSGVRQLFRVMTMTGKWIECTDNHKFPTPNGDKMLKDLSIGDELYILSGNISDGFIGKTDTIRSILFIRDEMTYDVTMSDPAHNFVANNGLVTSNSHSSAYALTAYISMFLKVHHPSEFITACINSWEGDIKGIIKTINEARRMGLEVVFDDWRNAESKTTTRDGKIYLGLNTIKGFGNSVAEALHRIAEKATTFTEVLILAEQESGISDTQLETLISHDFFSEFGDINRLLSIHEIFRQVYGRKMFNKNGNLPVKEEILRMFSKETEKQFRDIQSDKLLQYLTEHLEITKRPLTVILNSELKDFGYIRYTNSQADKMYYITEIDTKYSPKLMFYNLKRGLSFVAKIKKKDFNKNPVCVGNIIRANFEIKPKMRKEGDKFVPEPNIREFWVKNYSIVK